MERFGFAMGPFRVDRPGRPDIGWRHPPSAAQGSRHPAPRDPLIADRICELGRFGQKTGSGWYDAMKPACASPSPTRWSIRSSPTTAAAKGVTPRPVSDDTLLFEVVQRCVFALVNEGARILAEGIAAGTRLGHRPGLAAERLRLPASATPC
jgi:3-hydroxyacyl-CoA dehydrogenase